MSQESVQVTEKIEDMSGEEEEEEEEESSDLLTRN